jgi:NAD(P)H dehydrogenase (quinone)
LKFNRMAEWGADGRIVPGAPVHSAFIRRKEHLELE